MEKNKLAGLAIASNCGFHIVEVEDYEPQKGYTPFNFVVKNVEEIRSKLKAKRVKVTAINTGEPVRFDFIDLSGNAISVIQLN